MLHIKLKGMEHRADAMVNYIAPPTLGIYKEIRYNIKKQMVYYNVPSNCRLLQLNKT